MESKFFTNAKEALFFIIALAFTIGFFLVLYLLITKSVPTDNNEVLTYTLGALTAGEIAIVQYFFGSSKGSADKTKMLNGKS